MLLGRFRLCKLIRTSTMFDNLVFLACVILVPRTTRLNLKPISGSSGCPSFPDHVTKKRRALGTRMSLCERSSKGTKRRIKVRMRTRRDERPSTPPRFQGSQTRSEFKLERNLASNRGYYFLQHCERAFYAFTVPGCLAIETIKCKNFWYDARGISPGKLG